MDTTDGPSSVLERELKFSAAVSLALPDLRGLVKTKRLPEQQLHAAYFDTADLRLWTHGMTLRHRVGEGPEEGTWTLKLPSESAEAALERTELSWSGDRGSVPDDVTTILKGLLRHAELRNLFDLTTHRQRLALHTPDGDRLGELDDDRVTVEGGPRDGLQFRQLELELAVDAHSDQADLTDAVAEELTAAGARPGDGAKFAKALGDDATSAGRTRSLGKRARMGEVVRTSIDDGLRRLLDHDYLLRLEPSDPPVEAVHQARVASRRLRSDLKTLRAVLDPVWNDHMREDLRWLGNQLGDLRDLDVLREQFGSANASARETGLREIDALLCTQRRHAAAELHQALESERYLRLLERLEAGSVSPPLLANPMRKGKLVVQPTQRARKALPSVVSVPWRSLRKRVRKAGDSPTDEQLHKIRIGAKQLRYASELSSPVMGKQAKRTARNAEQLQTVLGEHHDTVFAEGWLRTESPNPDLSPTGILEAGRLMEVQRQRRADLRRQWRGHWHAVAGKKGRRWLRG